MTVREVSTITCDACGASRSSVQSRFTNRCPDNWAEVNVDYRDIAEEKTVYEEWHLCPDCTGALVLSIVKRNAENAAKP